MPISPRTLRPSSSFTPKSISGLALWLDASATGDLYTTDAGPVTAVSSPTEIAGCVGWWDFSHGPSVTAPGGIIESCNDRSGNGFHLSASSTRRPTVAAAIRNGLNAAEFDGSDDLMTATMSGAYTAATIFAVVFPDTSGGGTLGRVLTRGTSSLAYDGTSTALRYNAPFTGATGNGGQRTANNSAPQDQWHLASVTWSGGLNVATDIVPYLSGTASSAALAGTGDAISTSGINDFILGNRSVADGADRGWDGYIGEVILFSAALSATDRARVESYLAAKWGISGVHRPVEQEIAAVASPTEISGCKLWLDADDASSFTLVGGNVSEWRDKSGSGVPHATQSSAASRPTRTASGLNGKAVVDFQSAHSLTFASSTASFNFLHNATGATVFFVLKPDTASNIDSLRYILNNTNNSSANTGVSIFIDDRASVNRNNFLFASVNRGVSGQSTSSIGANNFYAALDAYSITSLTLDNANATAASRLLARLNGAQDANVNSITNAAATGNASLDLTIGNFGGLGAPAGIAEIIFYEGVLSATDRARVEKYLAAKWGIANVPDPTPPVGYWRDRSGNGRHATQSTGANRPKANTAGLNGGRSVQFFGGASEALSLGDLSSVFPSAGEIIVAYEPLSDSSYGLYETRSNSSYFRNVNGLSYFGTLAFGRQSGIAVSMPTSGRHVASMRCSSGGQQVVRLDGAQVFTGSPVNGYLAGTSHVLGNNNNPAADSGLTGYITDVLAFPRILTDPERTRIEKWLAARRGITLAPQVSNADAQDWVNRVYANGGAVTSSTASAVNSLCVDLENAGLRDRFYRLNLFCGTGLNACLVPLYRGPSLGGTQYGNTTDTNVGPFVSGDYVETGASGGLVGNGTSKYLNTGLPQSTIPLTNLHLSASLRDGETTYSGENTLIGHYNSTQTDFVSLRQAITTGAREFLAGSFGSSITSAAASSTEPHVMGVRSGLTATNLYRAGVSVSSSAVSVGSVSTSALPYFVFARNNSGTPNNYTSARLRMYSIGTAMDGTAALAFSNAVAAFNTALGRNV